MALENLKTFSFIPKADKKNELAILYIIREYVKYYEQLPAVVDIIGISPNLVDQEAYLESIIKKLKNQQFINMHQSNHITLTSKGNEFLKSSQSVIADMFTNNSQPKPKVASPKNYIFKHSKKVKKQPMPGEKSKQIEDKPALTAIIKLVIENKRSATLAEINQILQDTPCDHDHLANTVALLLSTKSVQTNGPLSVHLDKTLDALYSIENKTNEKKRKYRG